MHETGPTHPIAQLADQVRLYWAMLQASFDNLEVLQRKTADDASGIDARVSGEQRFGDSQANLRRLLLETISGIMPRLEFLIAESSLPAHAREFARHAVEDVTILTMLLADGVDVETCSCTTEQRARRQLARRLVGRDVEDLVDAGPDLSRLACLEAERRLAECIAVYSCANGMRDASRLR